MNQDLSSKEPSRAESLSVPCGVTALLMRVVPMIEPIMYFGIGFLFATLMGVAVIPIVLDRAVRLTLRRTESSLPQSMAEIQADKDLLRTEFAMSRRRLEIRVEELKEQNTSQLAELGRKSDVINRLKIEREVQKVETIGLKGEVEALKGRLN
jgi:FtsZ-binding cell division protein ZapB